MRGHAVLYNTPSDSAGWYTEIISRGAAAKAIASSDIRALLNHDSNILLARQKPGRTNNTLEVRETDKGVEFVFDVPKSRPEIIESIQRGDLDQTSFAFTVEDEVWTEENVEGKTKRTREIKEFKQMFDVSLVTYPFYEETHFEIDKRSYEAHKAAKDVEAKPDTPKRKQVSTWIREKELELRSRKNNY